MALDIPQIVALFETRGNARYGTEAVSQIEHALQCAQLAEEEGASAPLVVACLLHDLGHLLASSRDVKGGILAADVDDVHQYFALPFLRPLFGDEILEPIRLHVDAKRYLCSGSDGYWNTLSPASKRSLELQGGIFNPADAADFISRPHAQSAVQLRRWDDLAKTPQKLTPPLHHFAALMDACAILKS